ncbi:MAG: thiolase family protein [Lysobacteraceae bacterium]
MSDVVIAGAKRTPIGSFLGQFTGVPTPTLGAAAIKAALEHAGVPADAVEEAFIGCVLPAGLGQAPARQAALAAGLPTSVGCTTVNKVCGSGMRTVMMAADAIKAGSASIVVAGGMESMTNAPHVLNGSRTGIRYGAGELLDHMAWDGLTNPYDKQAMGVFADATAEKVGFSREDQDAFAAESARRALAAQQSGAFDAEIVPVTVASRKGDVTFSADEAPAKVNVEKIPTLKPAFTKTGTVTAASSSSISDGAAAVVLMSSEAAAARGVKPLAKVVAHATHAQEPQWFTTAPVAAIENVLKKAGWSIDEVDLFEINEAFACVAMAPIKQLGIPHAKVNVNGGACALGHPIGASGTRLIVTLLHALIARGGKRGVASLCIGGGEATAIAIELV